MLLATGDPERAKDYWVLEPCSQLWGQVLLWGQGQGTGLLWGQGQGTGQGRASCNG